MELHILIPFLMGILFTLCGDRIFVRLTRARVTLTNFQRFLFASGFAYACGVFSELALFFTDHYLPDADLRGAALAPLENGLLYRMFGLGRGKTWYPVFVTDFRILFFLCGVALAGVLLCLLLEGRSARRKDENGLFFGYEYRKKTPRAYIASEWDALCAELYLPEYIAWWALRALMLGAILQKLIHKEFGIELGLLAVNLSMTFVVPLVRLLFYRKLFFGKIPFRVQSLIDIFVFGGSYLQHGVGMPVAEFDKYLHVISGALAVLIGVLLIRSLRRGRELPAAAAALGGLGFSCTVIWVWEIFEFITDLFIPNADNQNRFYEPRAEGLFFRIFGLGADKTAAYGVLDTHIDMFWAFSSAVLCAVVFFAAVRLRRSGGPSARADGKRRAIKSFSHAS